MANNFHLMFEIRLNYSSVDKSLWPEDRTFYVFKKWFDVRFSNLILDMKTDSIEMI